MGGTLVSGLPGPDWRRAPEEVIAGQGGGAGLRTPWSNTIRRVTLRHKLLRHVRCRASRPATSQCVMGYVFYSWRGIIRRYNALQLSGAIGQSPERRRVGADHEF